MGVGRKPKPTYLKVLEGNPGKRALPKHEPKPAQAAPSCPRFLKGEARREWRRMVALLLPLGLLTRVDRAALAAYCVAWARWVKAEEMLAALDSGELVETESGVLHPWVTVTEKGEPVATAWLRISDAAMKQMRAFLVEFGMTPSSRSRVSVSQPAQQDPYEAFRQKRAAAD